MTINISYLKLKWALVLGSILQTLMIGACGRWIADAVDDDKTWEYQFLIYAPTSISAAHTVYQINMSKDFLFLDTPIKRDTLRFGFLHSLADSLTFIIYFAFRSQIYSFILATILLPLNIMKLTWIANYRAAIDGKVVEKME